MAVICFYENIIKKSEFYSQSKTFLFIYNSFI